jgi:hypothetical protein
MSQVAEEIEQFERRPLPKEPYLIDTPTPETPSNWWQRNITVSTVLSALFMLCYGYLFYDSIRPYWFHRGWTTDDALQQVFPFHEVVQPGVFTGDLITEVMSG